MVVIQYITALVVLDQKGKSRQTSNAPFTPNKHVKLNLVLRNMKTEQENWNTGFKWLLTDLVMCKKFSIDNMVRTPAVIILLERFENYGLPQCCLTAWPPSYTKVRMSQMREELSKLKRFFSPRVNKRQALRLLSRTSKMHIWSKKPGFHTIFSISLITRVGLKYVQDGMEWLLWKHLPVLNHCYLYR